MEPGYILNEYSELRKRNEFCYLVDKRYTNILPLHPSEAFVISLLDGEKNRESLYYLAKETYKITKEKSIRIVDTTIKKVNPFLTNSKRNKKPRLRYNPKEFLYNYKGNYPIAKYSSLESPLAINIVITRNCNFKCRYCFHDTNNQITSELPTHTILRLIEEAYSMDVAIIAFSGGEPFLHKGIFEVLSTTIENKLIPCISTNGSLLTKNYVDNLYHTGLQAIQVSLDSPTPAAHHYLTKTENSFRKVVAGIKALLSKGIWVRIRVTVTPFNLYMISELIGYLNKLAVQEIYIVPQFSGSCEVKINDYFRKLNEPELSYLINIVRSRKKQHPETKINMSLQEKEWESPKEIIRCGALFSSMTVLSTGIVTACEMIENKNLSLGNINEKSLQEIWEDKRYQTLRDKTIKTSSIVSECKDCQYLKFCRTGCLNLSKKVTGDFFQRDPRCPGPDFMNQF